MMCSPCSTRRVARARVVGGLNPSQCLDFSHSSGNRCVVCSNLCQRLFQVIRSVFTSILETTCQLNITITSSHLGETSSSCFCSQLRLVFPLARLQFCHCSNQLGVREAGAGIRAFQSCTDAASQCCVEAL